MKGYAMVKKSFRVILSVIVFFVLFSGASYGYVDKSPVEAYNFLDPGNANYIENAYLIDVRRPTEWLNDGHPGMDGADVGSFLEGKVFNIAWLDDSWQSNENFFDEVSSLFGSGDTLIIMCRSGVRSVSASNSLLSMETGENVTIFNMLTGFTGWQLDSLPYNFDPDGAWEPARVATPIPPSILMLGPALLGLLGVFRKKKNRIIFK
jgi:rhodanese-related sulfurtransferase